MGTPEFAVPGLKKMIDNDLSVVGVITAPDKPQGRGKKLKGSAVKQYAERMGLHILQPTNLKDPKFINELKQLNADLFIVVAFRMLPREVWEMPREGTFNLHASLLPQYRGAAPIHWAIINGEKETGLTTFFLKHEIDTGNIILQEKEPILDDDTTGSLYLRLMNKGADLILKTVQKIERGQIKTISQSDTSPLKEAPKIHKDTARINWSQPNESIRNFVRGMNPFPSAWTEINGNYYKVHEVKNHTEMIKPGELKIENKRAYIGCLNGSVELISIQPQGKRQMYINEFLAGNTF